MFARLQKVAAGKDIDDEGEKLNEVETVLNRLGVSLRSTQDEFRNMGDVLDEVGNKWSTFTSVEQAQIATAVAGTRQRENFLVLMQNYEQALTYGETALESEGTAMEKFGYYEESVEAKTQKLTAAVEGLINNFTDSDWLKAVLDLAKFAVNAADAINLLKGALMFLVGKGILMSITKIVTSFQTWRLTTQANTVAMSQSKLSLDSYTAALQKQGVTLTMMSKRKITKILLDLKEKGALEGLSAEMLTNKLIQQGVDKEEAKAIALQVTHTQATNKLAMAQGKLTAALGVVSIAFMAISSIVSAVEQHQQEALDNLKETTESYLESIKTTNSWQASLKNLEDTLTKQNITGQEYLDTQKQIIDIKNQVIEAFNDQEDAVYDYTKTLKENITALNEYQYQKWLNENEDTIKKAERGVGYGQAFGQAILHPVQTVEGLFNNELWVEEQEKEYQSVLKTTAEALIKSGQKEYSEYYYQLIDLQEQYEEAVKSGDKKLQEQLVQSLRETETKINTMVIDEPYVESYLQDVMKQINTLTVPVRLEANLDSLTGGTAGITLRQEINGLINDIFNSAEVPITKRTTETLKNAFAQLDAESNEFDFLYKELFTSLATEYGTDVDGLINVLGQLGLVQRTFNDQIEDAQGVLATYQEELKSTMSAIDTVASAQEEYNEYGNISTKTLDSLLSLDDKYLAMLVDENGQLNLNTDSYYDLAQAELEAMAAKKLDQIGAYLQSLDTEEGKVDELRQRYDELADSAMSAAAARGVASKYGISFDPTTGAVSTEGEGTQLYSASTELQAMVAEYNLYKSAIKGLGSGGASRKSGSSKSSSGSSKDTWLEAYKQELAELDHLKKMDKISTKEYYDGLNRLTKKYFSGRNKYYENERENLEKLWDLYKQILDEEKERYENALKYVDDVIDKKIEELEKEKKALEDKNKATEEEIKLEQLQANLRKAQQRTMRVYFDDVGWLWMADEEAVAEAQKELDDYNTQKAIDAIDDEIQAWKDYKKTWDDIPSDFEKMSRALEAQQLLGADSEAKILNQRIDVFNDFKAGYLKILQEIEDATAQSAKKQQELQLQMTTTPVNTTGGTGNGTGTGKGSGNGGNSGNGTNNGTNNGTATGSKPKAIDPFSYYNIYGLDSSGKLKTNIWIDGHDVIIDANGNYRGKKGGYAFHSTNFPNPRPDSFYGMVRLPADVVGGKIAVARENGMDLPYYDNKPTGTVDKPSGKGYGTKASGSPFINRSGMYNINENGAELGIHNPARGSYTYLTHGDGILNAGLTRNIMALASNPELAITNVLGRILAQGTKGTTNTQSQIINISNINLPNVSNANQFVKQLQLISQNH